jgi:hypothetical protein
MLPTVFALFPVVLSGVLQPGDKIQNCACRQLLCHCFHHKCEGHHHIFRTRLVLHAAHTRRLLPKNDHGGYLDLQHVAGCVVIINPRLLKQLSIAPVIVTTRMVGFCALLERSNTYAKGRLALPYSKHIDKAALTFYRTLTTASSIVSC